jgi:hypothetical protein
MHQNVTRNQSIATSNKQKCHFSKTENRMAEQGAWYQWEGGEYGRRVVEG